MTRKILCAIGIHRWGPIQDHFPIVPDEADCARLLYGDKQWPNYPYRRCEACPTRKHLPKTYGATNRGAA